MGTVTDHLGNEYQTEMEMCKYWGINHNTFTTRRRLGWSLERSLTEEICAKRKAHKVRDHLGNIYQSESEMCRSWGIRYSTFMARKHSGWSVGDALTKPILSSNRVQMTDHLGNTYNSIKAMCDYWGISYRVYSMRRYLGWDIEKALTEPVGHNVSDHLGNYFSSEMEMCKHWGIRYETFLGRKHRGWSLKRSLTETVRSRHTYNKVDID